MGTVDRQALEETLDRLVAIDVVRGWNRKPLGIYVIVLLDGRSITPSTKEAALWVMGASAAVDVLLMEMTRLAIHHTADVPPEEPVTKAEGPVPKDDVDAAYFAQLAQLGDLRRSGLLTPEMYQELRNKAGQLFSEADHEN